ncbi:MAG: 50S ribosomal protein L24 [Gammaproteobacteria bacterium GWE2_37_16]|nr:MAG: 50S ribosomal protein L24 [Gammaproteobacteria bacterium GWE2_37_16]
MSKIKKNDEVIVLTGKSRGVRGKVLSVVKNGQRMIVEGANMIKKHVRGNPQKNEQGGIIEREASIAVSNIALCNPVTNKADKVGFKKLEDGRKVRYFKSTGELVDKV